MTTQSSIKVKFSLQYEMEDAHALDFHFDEQEKDMLIESLLLLQQEFFNSTQWINDAIEEYLNIIDDLLMRIKSAQSLENDNNWQ